MISSLAYSPTTSPIEPQFLYQHLRLLNAADYSMADTYALVATELVENYLSRFLLNRAVVWTTSSDSLQANQAMMEQLMPWEWQQFISQPVVLLPRPASAITQVQVGSWNVSPDTTLVAGTDYAADVTGELGRIQWLTTAYQTYQQDHMIVTFTSGYGPTASSVPMSIQHAIVLLTCQLFENRGDNMPDLNSSAVGNLLGSYRLAAFG